MKSVILTIAIYKKRNHMRVDGRELDQLRKIEIIPDFLDHPAGSVLISCGQTRVLCTASVEDGVPKFRRDSGGGG
jgi:ribonuclease PH